MPRVRSAAALELTGIILTKADGDARGGAALSVRDVTGKPIVFLGVGEKLEALQPFDPERMASRILGMGDVVSLVEDVQRKVDVGQAEKLARKVVQGKGFSLLDLRSQLEQVRKLGGLVAVMDKLPTQLAGRACHAGRSGRPRAAAPDGHHRFHDRARSGGMRASSTARAAAALRPAPGSRCRTSTVCSSNSWRCSG